MKEVKILSDTEVIKNEDYDTMITIHLDEKQAIELIKHLSTQISNNKKPIVVQILGLQ